MMWKDGGGEERGVERKGIYPSMHCARQKKASAEGVVHTNS